MSTPFMKQPDADPDRFATVYSRKLMRFSDFNVNRSIIQNISLNTELFASFFGQLLVLTAPGNDCQLK